ncbi:MAG: hypothetical protein ACE5OW_07490 [Candidatus Bathyarchaeia archaeon]
MKKLLIKSSDFQYRAAYLAYSEAWDKVASQEAKKELNEILASLSKREIDYQTFYKKISRHRANRGKRRTRIKTQRKRDWRRKEKRKRRNARYKR